ncbi:MAG: hypothetical protein ACW97A_10695 [Candidatus Thorarchaeota archaeon]|jgi:F0F1-type ATP synthase assembly protein I
MSQSNTDSSSGLSGMGRWFAIGSELPCTVIALMLVGQVIGSSLQGLQGATWGAVIGAILGFFLGAYGVYATIGYYERIDKQASVKRAYQPPIEEIHEDVTFPLDDDEEA